MSALGQFSCWPKMGNDDVRRRIINLLMLHAWRRRREHSEEARILINNLSNQVFLYFHFGLYLNGVLVFVLCPNLPKSPYPFKKFILSHA